MSGQVQSSAGLMRVKEPDDIQAKVPLQPLDVRVSAVKYLRPGKKAKWRWSFSDDTLKLKLELTN